VTTHIRHKVIWGFEAASGRFGLATLVACLVAVGATANAQTPVSPQQLAPTSAPAPAGVALPPGYLIGPEDVLTIVVWREKDMSTDAVVRPDGQISIPLLNDLQAAGLTPDQLRATIEKAASKYVAEPNATVIVKAINSRKVHILGNVIKAGTYPLAGDTTVLQLIAQAGGLQEWADSKRITVMRKEDGKDTVLSFNYKDVVKQKNLQQNVLLKPGDTVIVP
jgi:polysaccharide export outer membrane protein